MNILCIDDSKTIHVIVSNALSVLDVEVTCAANGEEGLEYIEKSTTGYSLVLLDWNMPGISGLEVLQSIKKNEKTEAVPVIMLTSEGSNEFVEQAMSAGASGYIVKPFPHQDLVNKVMQMLAQNI